MIDMHSYKVPLAMIHYSFRKKTGVLKGWIFFSMGVQSMGVQVTVGLYISNI